MTTLSCVYFFTKQDKLELKTSRYWKTVKQNILLNNINHSSNLTRSNKNVRNIWVLRNFYIKGSFYFLTLNIYLMISSEIIVAASWFFILLLHLNFILTFSMNLSLGITSTSSSFINTFIDEINSIEIYF